MKLTEVRSTVTGDIDLNGILGLDAGVRNGYEQITVRFTVKGDAPAETLREIVERSRARSAVFDVITNHRRGHNLTQTRTPTTHRLAGCVASRCLAHAAGRKDTA